MTSEISSLQKSENRSEVWIYSCEKPGGLSYWDTILFHGLCWFITHYEVVKEVSYCCWDNAKSLGWYRSPPNYCAGTESFLDSVVSPLLCLHCCLQKALWICPVMQHQRGQIYSLSNGHNQHSMIFIWQPFSWVLILLAKDQVKM